MAGNELVIYKIFQKISNIVLPMSNLVPSLKAQVGWGQGSDNGEAHIGLFFLRK